MKLVRYGEAGSEKPGLIDASGAIRDLSGVVPDIDGSVLSDDSLARLRAIDEELRSQQGAEAGPPDNF